MKELVCVTLTGDLEIWEECLPGLWRLLHDKIGFHCLGTGLSADVLYVGVGGMNHPEENNREILGEL